MIPHENITFQKKDYRIHHLEKGEYEGCIFSHCNFVKSDISHIRFTDCEFTGCDLSMVKMIETSMQNVKFSDSKMLGTEWKNCNAFLFEVSYEDCILELATFAGMKIKNITFKNSDLSEANFIGSDLSSALFEKCNLEKALFQNTILEKADLSTSYGYILDPENNKLKGAKFSLDGLSGLLRKYNIIVK